MPSDTVHRSHPSEGPPPGGSPIIEAADHHAAMALARRRCPKPSHRPAVGSVHGVWICDDPDAVVVSWQAPGR